VPVFIIQGAITLLAGVAEPYLTGEIITEMSAVGGPVFLAMSVNMLEFRQERIKVGDMIPAILMPIVYFPAAELLGRLIG